MSFADDQLAKAQGFPERKKKTNYVGSQQEHLIWKIEAIIQCGVEKYLNMFISQHGNSNKKRIYNTIVKTY